MSRLVSTMRGPAVLVIVATAVLTLAGPRVNWALAETDPKPTSVAIAPIEQPEGEPAVLAATLTDANGTVLGGQPLRFYVETDAFGPRLMKVGEALTDVSGTASVTFKPTWLGENKVTVIYPGNEAFARSQAQTTFNAVGPVSLHENADFGIQAIRDWAPVVASSLVLVVWTTLLVVLFRTFRVMRTSRSKSAVPANQAAAVPLPTDER